MLDLAKLRVADGKSLTLADRDPAATQGLDKDSAQELLDVAIKRLNKLQYKLHAASSHAVLIVLQGMDASGKDGIIRHLAAGLNPQGCEVTSFKQPTMEELQHDFLWRCHMRLPRKGRIGIFNRSHYEDVLVTRVHPELLLKAKLPGIKDVNDVRKSFWDERLAEIRDFETTVASSGTLILKFFLHSSADEQKKRLLERIDEAEKNWKFDIGDLSEREHWLEYESAYEHALRSTSTKTAPWYVIPSDKKWFARTAICTAVVEALETLDLRPPTLSAEAKSQLDEARKKLLAQD